ncbi:MAG: hypothetical protein Kow0042_24440 [Calditrichia bacterium]
MKRMNYIFTGIYIFIALYIAIFNWEIFSVSLNLNLGFTAVKIPVIAGIFLWGLFFLLIHMLGTSLVLAKSNKKRLQLESELNALKSPIPEANLAEKSGLSETLSALNEKMDILINHFNIKNPDK